MEDIDKNLARQKGYFDTKYLTAKECDELREFHRMIPGFSIMRHLTTICGLRIGMKRERIAAAKKERALQLIVAIAPTRRVSAAAMIARDALGIEVGK